MSEAVGMILAAAFGSVGLWQLVMYLINRRANQRKAEAEADKGTAEALVAAVGVRKAGYEAESVALTNYKEVMAQAILMMNELRQELDEAQDEKRKTVEENRRFVEENRKLQAQIRHLDGEVQQMSRKFGAIEMVVVDIAVGVKRLSDQLRERGLEPIWKPTFTLSQFDDILSPEVKGDIEQLLK